METFDDITGFNLIQKNDIHVTLVSAASSNHFHTLCQLIDNVSKTKWWTGFCFRLIVYDIGLSDTEWADLNQKFASESITLRKLNFDKYPSFMRLDNKPAGYFAWKPAITAEVADELLRQPLTTNNVLIWFDSGNLIHRPLRYFMHHVYRNGIYTDQCASLIETMTNPQTLRIMNTPTEFMKLRQRGAGCVGFDLTNPNVVKLIQKWKEFSLQKDCIAPIGSTPKNHRYDQSIFSILYYEYRRTQSNLEDDYLKHGVHPINDVVEYTVQNDIDEHRKWVIEQDAAQVITNQGPENSKCNNALEIVF
jgi:hypothetical protein